MTLPSFLYKYQPVTRRNLENLRKHQIWFSKPYRFNDAYDCANLPSTREMSEVELAEYLPSVLERIGKQALDPKYLEGDSPNALFKDKVNKDVAKTLPQITKEMLHEMGIACFSTSKDSLLMWSHYAKGHKGFCLEFDTSFEPFPKAYKVDYSPTMPSISLAAVLLKKEGAMREMVLTKADCWTYEDEWRLLSPQGDLPSKYKPSCLTGVFFGVAMGQNHKCKIMRILRDSPAKFYQMNRHEDEFRLDWTQITQCP
jgi:Protein of unknown function (DUF2971)